MCRCHQTIWQSISSYMRWQRGYVFYIFLFGDSNIKYIYIQCIKFWCSHFVILNKLWLNKYSWRSVEMSKPLRPATTQSFFFLQSIGESSEQFTSDQFPRLATAICWIHSYLINCITNRKNDQISNVRISMISKRNDVKETQVCIYTRVYFSLVKTCLLVFLLTRWPSMSASNDASMNYVIRSIITPHFLVTCYHIRWRDLINQ